MTARILLILASALAISACSPSNFFLGEDNRPEPKPLPETSTQIQSPVIWSQSVGKVGADRGLRLRPATDGQRLYVISADGRLSAFNARSGDRLYQYDLDTDISAGVTAAPGLLFAVTRNGDLLALSAENGEPRWRASLGESVLAAPSYTNDMVVVRASSGAVFAYRASDGVVLWQYRISEPKLVVRGDASPVVGGGVVIVTTNSGRLVVLDQASGMPMVEERLAIGSGNNDVQRLVDMDATPKINGSTLFASAFQDETFAVSLEGGNILWRQPQAATAQDFAMSPDGLFLANDIDHVIALNQNDGSIRWQNDALEGRYLSPLVAIPPGIVGGIDGEGYLHWFDSRDGRLIGQNKIGSTYALSEPVVLNSGIAWQLADGKLVVVAPR
ncbi:outer membrane protein assembly factor BamB [Suttonella sp. R2A3]|uniref:outer membrane protein assembly factor BamB n=1 Tax=Suttonella sp. R2A3 TaxID=2908648 RepID=UPI001F263F45|nr:outer membrane protein assembly factor BamB [Suttonella sp. R2A3]UJF23799.1 outer membrane protein assembly factor BamB [Suttonella sp. R2A3]